MISLDRFNPDLLPVIKPFTGADVVALREAIGVSQSVLALIFNVSVSTVRKWEYSAESNALKGGDLLIANQLASQGLSGYLHGTVNEGVSFDIKEAIYSVLANCSGQSGDRVVVKMDAINELKASMGLRSVADSPSMMIRQERAKALGVFAAQVGELIAASSTVEEIKAGFNDLLINKSTEI
jgi:hypothetical protein